MDEHVRAGDPLTWTVPQPSDSGEGLRRTAEAYRDTVGRYASGVTVITGLSDGAAAGFTCQSFHSVSLEPRLVLISVMRSSTTYPRVRASGCFAVNVLAEGQEGMSDRFARSGTDKWAGVPWRPSPAGLPVIEGVLAWLDCTIRDEHPAGDHLIVVGEVTAFGTTERERRSPLIFYNRAYSQIALDALESH
jgi:flavin reductase (DIM6/NTAB) family NADH-FMN oxidoreductase RutF